jgi:hypothetical protein
VNTTRQCHLTGAFPEEDFWLAWRVGRSDNFHVRRDSGVDGHRPSILTQLLRETGLRPTFVKLLCPRRSDFCALDTRGRFDVGNVNLNVFNLPINFAEPVRRAWGIDDDVTHTDFPRQTTFDSAQTADGGIRIPKPC